MRTGTPDGVLHMARQNSEFGYGPGTKKAPSGERLRALMSSGCHPRPLNVQRQAQKTTFPDGLSILHRVVLCTRFGTYPPMITPINCRNASRVPSPATETN